MGDCLGIHDVVAFIFKLSRLSLFIDKWLSVRINKLTMTFLQELSNSNYCNTRPVSYAFVHGHAFVHGLERSASLVSQLLSSTMAAGTP